MATVRCEVTVAPRASDPPKDFITNTVHHTITTAGGLLPADYQNHANEVRDVFSGVDSSGARSPFITYSGRKITVKAYDLADSKPRPVKATAIYTPTTYESAPMGPRDVALCVSFYADRNLPRQRGRLYIGPIILSLLGERPDATLRDRLLSLADHLNGIGGVNVSWVVHSPTTNTDHDITYAWVNDVWDTMRKRDVKETVRDHSAY